LQPDSDDSEVFKPRTRKIECCIARHLTLETNFDQKLRYIDISASIPACISIICASHGRVLMCNRVEGRSQSWYILLQSISNIAKSK